MNWRLGLTVHSAAGPKEKLHVSEPQRTDSVVHVEVVLWVVVSSTHSYLCRRCSRLTEERQDGKHQQGHIHMHMNILIFNTSAK